MTTRGFPLAEWCLILAKKDNSLPCASLFTDFSESKKSQKIFAAQTPPRKRGYVEDFAHRNHLRLRNLKNSRFALPMKLCCEIAARQARGYGVLYEVKLFLVQVLPFIYSNSQQDTLFRPARLRRDDYG